MRRSEAVYEYEDGLGRRRGGWIVGVEGAVVGHWEVGNFSSYRKVTMNCGLGNVARCEVTTCPAAECRRSILGGPDVKGLSRGIEGFWTLGDF